jgi:uncharacterized spore protein YtfJ
MSNGNDVAAGLEGTLSDLKDVVARFAESANARACIGEAQHVEGRTVIPLAAVSLQTGFGFGFGSGGTGEGAQAGSGRGAAGGGGGRSSSRVVAVVDIGPEGVRVLPVVDVNSMIRNVLMISVGATLVARGRRGALRALRRSTRDD